MIGYFYDNDETSKEWGKTIEVMSEWFREGREYKEKYEELLKKYETLENSYEALWEEYRNKFEEKKPRVAPHYPWTTSPSIDSIPCSPWYEPVITYLNNI